MTVRITGGGTITLDDVCSSEDAEELLRHLLNDPRAPVNWRNCRSAHTAVIQVLMAAKPELLGPPADDGLKKWVEPVLTRLLD